MKTAKELVSYAHAALKAKWGYVWGSYGKILTETEFERLLKQYPDGVGKYKDFIQSHWLNKPSTDCVGLIKGFLWWDGTNYKYDPKTDVNANMMFEKAKAKGAINTMPDHSGILVWKQGHIGVYVGGNEVIEANSTKRGVIKTPLSGNGATPWTHWCECPFIEYKKTAAPTKASAKPVQRRTLKIGMKGDDVKALQKALNQLSFSVLVDGDFGKKTESTLKSFQMAKHLQQDGIAGPRTLSALGLL